jgi:alpha-amylase
MIDRMNRISLLAILLLLGLSACTASRQAATPRPQAPFFWENANVYFMLTDRFFNGNPKNDLQFGRTRPAANLRGFMGGDIKGITQKLEEGYFDQLGITAIWFTPVLEQIHDAVDEGTGATYGFHDGK